MLVMFVPLTLLRLLQPPVKEVTSVQKVIGVLPELNTRLKQLVLLTSSNHLLVRKPSLIVKHVLSASPAPHQAQLSKRLLPALLEKYATQMERRRIAYQVSTVQLVQLL